MSIKSNFFSTNNISELTYDDFKKQILNDYLLAWKSREVSLLGRKEVLSGKAKFGIFGAGKEVAQLAMAHAFKKGDWRSGYYRDQTFTFATGIGTISEFFAQLYADPRPEHDPHSMGRQMNSHWANRLIDENGEFISQTDQYNNAADMAPTASQMARAVGLGLASKLYRNTPELADWTDFSKNGNEVCFATIGDASCAEGIFWEAMNAMAVQQLPICVSVWDDGYGISVPTKFQIAKGSISEVLSGLRSSENEDNGIDIYIGYGWDYSGLINLYQQAIQKIRKTHRPALIHIKEVTQPQGHSTSGSHQRYKSEERLKWEKEMDCLVKMKEWIIENDLASEQELSDIEKEARTFVRETKQEVYSNFQEPIKKMVNELILIGNEIVKQSPLAGDIIKLLTELSGNKDPMRRDVFETANAILRLTHNEFGNGARVKLISWKDDNLKEHHQLYNSFLYNETSTSALKVNEVKAVYSDQSESLNGFQILNKNFDANFAKYPNLFAFGEDVGKIGGVNQTMSGMQEKYGINRVFDTGIREATIVGQAIGMAFRGLRPMAEIQYLDYLIYGLQPLTDDLASLHFRTGGRQIAPAIIRTRGHRLEGIWHTGSPLGMMLSTLRGMHICVPRNMVQAAGMYNTLLQANDPAIVIECLNGYRLKEKMPDNLNDFTVPLGIPEILNEGTDITLVTYGSLVRIAEVAVNELAKVGISVELIDVQTLLPFDINNIILNSAQKTNRLVLLDEDVPGGGTGFMMQQLIDKKDLYWQLDSKPIAISAKAHRGAYGSDGDYFGKPSKDEIFEKVYEIMNEFDPSQFPIFY